MTRRFNLTLLFVLAGIASIFGSTPQEAVNKFISGSGVKAATMAVKITDLSNGETIGSHNTETPLVPASIMKSVTTAALLDKGGADFRYHTRVFIDGPLDMGILRGNLIVVGSGDPSLHSSAEPYGTDIINEIGETLSDMGIIQVEGNVIIDQSEFAGPSRPASWMPADFSTTYGTGFHALNFRNNISGNRAVENPASIFTSQLKSGLKNAGITVIGKNVGIG
ncbi:MAG: D-alanyl-D-alanine carboxypeptidase, partial [Muribaculaceae bacterium]|nr:D-alanyl-D-alanine carboxypeptidase [Muribaculaceae bacterium]